MGPLRARSPGQVLDRSWMNSLYGYQPSITEKRLYSRGTFNPDAGFLSRLEAADHLFLRGVPLFGDEAWGICAEKHRTKVDFNNFTVSREVKSRLSLNSRSF